MSDIVDIQPTKSKRQKWLYRAIALAVFLVGLFVIYKISPFSKPKDAPEIANPIGSVNSLVGQKKYDEAKKAAGSGKTTQSLQLLGVIEVNQGNWQAAFDLYKKAGEKFGYSININNMLAQCSEKLGNKPTAIAYYRAVIAGLEKQAGNPVKDSDIADAKASIARLQK